jgi:glycogen debranching enzyme
MGPFITAYIKANGGTKKSRQKAAEWLTGIHEHLSDAGLGQISEIFDADAPHKPCGCMAQAWSVAEMLRAMVEDVLDESNRRLKSRQRQPGVRLRGLDARPA